MKMMHAEALRILRMAWFHIESDRWAAYILERCIADVKREMVRQAIDAG
jgi:hypothetical protein